MRVLLTGGGTSGHVNPALAIADIIKAREPDSVFAYVGTERGIEKKLVEKEGYEFFNIDIRGIKRSLSLSNVKAAYLVMSAPRKAESIIKKFNPDVVIGTGGYVCWAPLKAAASLGIPSVVHESNSTPGLAVRKLENKVNLILTNFKSTGELLTECECVVNVGNPTRNSFSELTRSEARRALNIPESAFVILSFGGSLGAPALNGAAVSVMREFSSVNENVYHFHSGGRNYYKNAMEMFAGYNLEKHDRLNLSEYIYDMPTYMRACDLVICRAGAMTLTELASCKKSAILIPSPNVTDNHQYKNAKVLADAGAAVLVEQNANMNESVVEAVRSIYEDKEKRESMSAAIQSFANPNVADEVYGAIKRLVVSRAKITRKD